MANDGIIDTAADVAEATALGFARAVAVGAVPLLIFGAMVGVSILIVQLPLRFLDGE